MKLIAFGVLALLVATPAVATASAQATTVSRTDQALDTRIAKRIHSDPSLKKYDIKVSVDGTVAKLSGTVATEADRTKAAELAKVPGITRVDNQIVADLNADTRPKGTAGKVESKSKEAAEKTKEGGEKVIEKSKEGGEKAAEKTKEAVSKTGEVITDAWITTRVKSKFIGEDLLKDSNIDVTTDNHIVTLTGTVMTPAARARAVVLVKEVEGVRRVVDKLTVGPKK